MDSRFFTESALPIYLINANWLKPFSNILTYCLSTNNSDIPSVEWTNIYGTIKLGEYIWNNKSWYNKVFHNPTKIF